MSRWIHLVPIGIMMLAVGVSASARPVDSGGDNKAAGPKIEIVFDASPKVPVTNWGNGLGLKVRPKGSYAATGSSTATDKTIATLIGPTTKKIRVLNSSNDWKDAAQIERHLRALFAAHPKTIYRYQPWAEAVPQRQRIVALIEHENGKKTDLEVAGSYVFLQDQDGIYWWIRLSQSFDKIQLLLEKQQKPKHLLSWGKKGGEPGEFYSPIGIAINAKDEVFVTDLNNARLQSFSTDGKHRGGFDLPRDDPKRKSTIIGGILLDEPEHIYLAFMNQHKIGVYAHDGKLVREWGKKGDGDGDFHQPGGMVFGPDGNLYVCDQCNHRIQKFTKDGKFLAKWGEHGAKPGQFGGVERKGSRFGGPHFLSIDSKGRLYTTEGCEARIQQLSLDGKPLAVWGNKTQEPGGFGALKLGFSPNPFGPIGVFVDRHDRVWVSSLNDRVQCFTAEGKYLFGIAGTGKEPGQLSRPHGMAMDSKGHLYVCDASNQRIQKFELPPP